jgi:hypothetical protein
MFFDAWKYCKRTAAVCIKVLVRKVDAMAPRVALACPLALPEPHQR